MRFLGCVINGEVWRLCIFSNDGVYDAGNTELVVGSDWWICLVGREESNSAMSVLVILEGPVMIDFGDDDVAVFW